MLREDQVAAPAAAAVYGPLTFEQWANPPMGCASCFPSYSDDCPFCGVDARFDGSVDGFADPHPSESPQEYLQRRRDEEILERQSGPVAS